MGSARLTFDELTLEGVSRAGDETWFRVHPPGLAFDVGRGAPELTGAADIFLSHVHLDHVSGLPWVLSQRSLQGLPGPRIHCPAEIVESLTEWIEASERLDRATYEYDLVPMSSGERVAVGRDLRVEAFATDHVVPSLGYHLIRRLRRLGQEYRSLEPAEIIRRKSAGEEVEVESEILWLSYCGDTGEAVFELEPRLFESRILLLECTFMGGDSRRRARDYRHIHLDDLTRRGPSFRNELLVLHHRSRRHSSEDLARAASQRLEGLMPEVILFPENA